MRVTELDVEGGYLYRAVVQQRAKEQARTGLHCSTIINDMLQTMDPKRYGREISQQGRIGYQEFGNVLEDVIALRLRRRVRGWGKPEPRHVRGIWGSPDGYSVASRTIDEIKATWISEADFVTTDARGTVIEESLKFSSYMWQAVFYALAWEAVRIRLHVLFVNGAYPRGAPIPSPRTFIIRCSDQEKEANYQRLRQHAIDRQLDGYKGLLAA